MKTAIAAPVGLTVLGLDPGTATTGFAIVHYIDGRLSLIDVGVLLTASTMEMSERLLSIHTDVHTLIERYQPEAVACERLFFDKNITTGMMVARAVGVMQVAVAQRALPWFEYTPMQVKMSVTNYGAAEKSQIQAMVVKLLHLPETPRPDDAADACAVAICHAHSNKMKGLGMGASRGHRRDHPR